jgi:PPOX class probable FMN-dependent enzyme
LRTDPGVIFQGSIPFESLEKSIDRYRRQRPCRDLSSAVAARDREGAARDRRVDASPRGGNPGFIHVVSPTQLVMPDRSGNNRIDSFRNIVEGSGKLQVIFFVPGIDETLRVGGTGRLSAEPDLLASMEEFGKPPRAVLSIAVREAYFHCGKALMRSKLWSPDVKVERAVMPSIGQIIYDQTTLGEPEPQAAVEARYKTQL